MTTGSDSVDFIVVGSGSTGTSIAYHLASLGKSVKVVDIRGIAGGNTGKSSALVRTHYSNELIARMALYSRRVFEKFDNIGYSGFTRTGMFFPFGSRYRESARENIQMLRSVGVHEDEVDSDFVRQFYPDINLEGYEYISYEPDSGHADPVATANAFADKAKELGAVFLTKNRAVRVDVKSGMPEVTLDDGTVHRASKVILATNVWTNELLSSSGVSKDRFLPINASLHGVIYLRRPENYRKALPTFMDPKHLSYYKMEGTSLMAIGSLDPSIDKENVDLNGFIPETVEDGYIEEHLSMLMEIIPSMEKATLVSSITGLYDMTPDGQAFIDSLNSMGLDNVYVCAGLSGHGFKLSPAYGKMVSEMVTGVAPDNATFDWRNFSIDRFERNKPIKSRYEEIGTIY